MNNHFYTTDQVAEQLDISKRRVQAMIKAGQIQAQKMGRDWVIFEDELQRILSIERKPGRPKKEEA